MITVRYFVNPAPTCPILHILKLSRQGAASVCWFHCDIAQWHAACIHSKWLTNADTRWPAV